MKKTQEDLAGLVDVDQSRVARWERGDSYPEPEFRKKLAEHLGVEESFFDVDERLLAIDLRPEIMELLFALASADDGKRDRIIGYADSLLGSHQPQTLAKPKGR